MNAYEEFRCPVNDMIPMQNDIIDRLNVTRQSLYEDPKKLASYSKQMMQCQKLDTIYLPPDHILEAEAFGAVFFSASKYEISPVPNALQPRSMDELWPFPAMHFSFRALGTVISAAKLLQEEQIPVVFHISGPCAILNQFYDSAFLLRGFRKNPQTTQKIFSYIKEQLLLYIDHLICNGIHTFSIADPLCSADIIGPNMKKAMIQLWLPDLLTQLSETYHNHIRIQMCPRLHGGLDPDNPLQKNIPAICPAEK